MKKIWYFGLRIYVRSALKLYYREIKVMGKPNIPADRAVIFLPNHQNTFIDALLIACFSDRESYYLARADVFNKPFLRWLMSTINLYPIYRIRDGASQLNRNEEIFNICQEALQRGLGVMLHPESTHSLQKKVRPLSKGFSRIALGALEKYPGLAISYLPVGLNYDFPTAMGSRVSIYYGQPIAAEAYTAEKESVQQLKEEVYDQLTELTVHIASPRNHQQTYDQMVANDVDLTDPHAANAYLKGKRIFPRLRREAGQPFWYYPLLPLALWIMWPVILLWKIIKGKIADPAFYGALKFSFGLIPGPFLILINALLLAKIFDWWLFPLLLVLGPLSLPSLALLEDQYDYVRDDKRGG